MKMVSRTHRPNNSVTASYGGSKMTVEDNGSASTRPLDNEKQLTERRNFLKRVISSTVATAAVACLSMTMTPDKVNAYEQSYPIELESIAAGDGENSSNSLSKLKEERLSNKKAKVAATQSELRNDPLGLHSSFLSASFGPTVAGSLTWGLALWLATGSRSNPVVKPLGNALYDAQEETWLADRNDGYFAEPPAAFLALLLGVFVVLGVLADRAVYFLADGDADVSLALAGVSAIAGAVWEVGRLAAEEKAPTRREYEREALLSREFADFAARRLLVGTGSCHRSEVIRAFRRYNPKYRRADDERYPLPDIQIERLLRAWNRELGSRNEMSSAGFFAGITVDSAADAFAPR